SNTKSSHPRIPPLLLLPKHTKHALPLPPLASPPSLQFRDHLFHHILLRLGVPLITAILLRALIRPHLKVRRPALPRLPSGACNIDAILRPVGNHLHHGLQRAVLLRRRLFGSLRFLRRDGVGRDDMVFPGQREPVARAGDAARLLNAWCGQRRGGGDRRGRRGGLGVARRRARQHVLRRRHEVDRRQLALRGRGRRRGGGFVAQRVVVALVVGGVVVRCVVLVLRRGVVGCAFVRVVGGVARVVGGRVGVVVVGLVRGGAAGVGAEEGVGPLCWSVGLWRWGREGGCGEGREEEEGEGGH
ncbi:hypothetical protein EDC01DRAFT_750110, partial [Geopyxis carbonaria]